MTAAMGNELATMTKAFYDQLSMSALCLFLL
jgi:hypothetical protein